MVQEGTALTCLFIAGSSINQEHFKMEISELIIVFITAFVYLLFFHFAFLSLFIWLFIYAIYIL